jgi:L-ascorbate metabolism protein UlaG (beta-lactamase superfamily)
LTYLGHCAFSFDLNGLRVYTDPYIKDPLDWTKLDKGHIVLLSHGHFDHGVLMVPELWKAWRCKFVAPGPLVQWMKRKYRRHVPADAYVVLNAGQTTKVQGLEIQAVPAHHPLTRLGKTILTLFARSSAPGKPVNGYYFAGYYFSGDTIYTPTIAQALKGKKIHTACLPIGGKYKVASPQEALRIAEEIGAQNLVPMHWQALMHKVPFRYQPSDLVKLAKSTKSKVRICPLAFGEVFE